MKAALDAEPNVSWVLGAVGRLVVEGGAIRGVKLETGALVSAGAVVVTTGTFLNGLIHVGPEQTPAGRAGEPPARELAESLKSCGFVWGRLKTGTPPRLNSRSIDFEGSVSAGLFREERGDPHPVPFSFGTDTIEIEQIICYRYLHTDRVHEIVRENIGTVSPFQRTSQGVGPRYCPSLEDKVMRFPDRERHQIYLEPEGRDSHQIYVNGLLDEPAPRRPGGDRESLPGLRDAEILRHAYAVEYDFIQPTELRRTLETKRVEGCIWQGRSMELPDMRRRPLRDSWPASTRRVG